MNPQMKNFMKTLHVLFSLVLLAGVSQAGSLRFLAWDHEVAAKKLQVRNGGSVHEIVDLHPDKRSEWVSGINAETGTFLVAPQVLDAKGQPAIQPLVIPRSVVDPLVILLPDRRQPTGLTVFVVEDSAAGFQFGATRFLNATTKPLTVRYGKSLLRLEKSWAPTDVNSGGKARNLGIQIETGGTPSMISYSAVWEYDPDARKIAIIAPGTDSDAGVLAVKVISENRRALTGL